MKYFPLFVDLRDRNILITGNGPETESKVEQMLDTGARIHVVGSEPLPGILERAKSGKLKYSRRQFEESDLDDVWLVIGTSRNSDLNKRIAEAAAGRKIFCNIVDVTQFCSFIYPAIVSHEDVHIAISTSGNSPALAQRLKREIAEQIGPEYGELNDLLGKTRAAILENITDNERRQKLFHELVESNILELLRKNEKEKAERVALDLIGKAISKPLRETISYLKQGGRLD